MHVFVHTVQTLKRLMCFNKRTHDKQLIIITCMSTMDVPHWIHYKAHLQFRYLTAAT